MRNLLLILMVALLSINTAMAANRYGDTYHEIQIEDETGRVVDDITNLYIYGAGGTTDAVIYMDKNRQNTITIPMTEASANTTLVDGVASWWGPDAYDFSMSNTDAAGPLTNSGHADRSGNDGRLIFPSYLQSMSTTAWLDAQSISMGTGAEWVINGGGVADTLSFIPAADNSNFIVGSVNASYTSSFYVPTGATDGLTIASAAFTWNGGAVLLNDTSNHNVGICTGTSTGATSIGNSAGGAFALDTTSTITVNADDAVSITNSTASAVITIDSTAGSVLIDAGESATDSIIVRATGATGGIELICGTGDITLDSGDDIFLEANTGVGDVISIINTAGTDAAAIVMTTTAAGSFDINSGDNITIDVADDLLLTTVDGPITLTAGTTGDISLISGDDTIITSSGKVTITNTEAVTISGALTMTGLATLTGINQQVVEVGDVTAYDVLAANSGKLHVIPDLTGDLTMDLPTEAAGLYFKFIYVGGAEDAQDWIIDSEANANFFTGGLNTYDDDDTGATPVYSDNTDDSICTVLTPGTGTEVEIWCDGTIWFINGTVVSGTATSVTFTNL